MKGARAIGLVVAVLFHVGVILFGGLFFLGKSKDKQKQIQTVDLLSDVDAEKPKDDKNKPEQPREERIESEPEKPPDSSEIIRNLEVSAAASAPALEAVSLSALESALSGNAGGGDVFGEAVSFASGGRIGGMATSKNFKESTDAAFAIADVDQKPRPLFQAAPTYPASMRQRKLAGQVVLVFVVDKLGRVANPQVEKSSDAAFDRPALEAVRQWRFEPAVRGGQKVQCKMRVPIRFSPS